MSSGQEETHNVIDSMMDKIIEVKEISKYFRKNALASNSNFRETLAQRWTSLFKKDGKAGEESIIALEDVSFELKKGDVLGVIGRNGAGKSTLLKILAGILQPSKGEVTYKGRLVSILELGAGFHPDLTGAENVFLNGSLLGLSKKEINTRFDAIVAFSGIQESIHQPVKYYSNGMYLRLAFAVFTHLDLDILLLDEVMAVGDAIFRQKSYNQISELSNSGTTIILVSHNPHEIKDLCNKCIWFEAGKVAAFGNTAAVVDQYLEKSFLIDEPENSNTDSEKEDNFLVWPDGFSIKEEIVLYRFGIKASTHPPATPISLTDDLEITVEFEKLNDHHSIEFTICILSFYSTWVLVDSYGIYDKFHRQVLRKGNYICKCTIPAGVLNFGVYQLGFLVAKDEKLIYQIPGLLNFKIDFTTAPGMKKHLAKEVASIIKPMGNWEIERIAD